MEWGGEEGGRGERRESCQGCEDLGLRDRKRGVSVEAET